MAIINTQRNIVYAREPQPDDVFVQVGWSAPTDGVHRRTITLPYSPISAYREAVAFAVSMADMLVYPVHVVTLNHSDFLNTGRFEPYRNMLANLNDQERGEMRQLAITTCAEILRDCDEWEVRAEAYDLLVQLKVVRP